MFGFGKPSTIPSPADALPGRDTPIRTAERHYVNDTSIKPPYPAGSELATFALGCFWGAEKLFWQMPGVLSTSVGYAGGSTPNPTYEEVCRVGPAMPRRCRSSSTLRSSGTSSCCKRFWEDHDPTQGMRQGNDRGTQYRSAIYTHSRCAARDRHRVARHVPGAS